MMTKTKSNDAGQMVLPGALFQVLGSVNGKTVELRVDYSRIGPQWALVIGVNVTWFWFESAARDVGEALFGGADGSQRC